MDARPFAPLPGDWNRPSLRVMFSFEFKPEARMSASRRLAGSPCSSWWARCGSS
jgi:hypothetical protein